MNIRYKYEHIPTGITAIKDNTSINYIIDFTNGITCPRHIHQDIVENGSDWKRISGPNWKILSFRGKLKSNKGLFELGNDGKYRYETWDYIGHLSLELEIFLNKLKNNEETHEIYSVQRLSDGRIFTLGDLISKFEIWDVNGSNEMMVTYDKNLER